MDWDKALSRNEVALLRIVASLFGLLLDARLSGSGLMIPRHVWRSILFVIRPAEAAVRRLIIIAARALAQVAFVSRTRVFNASPTAPQVRANVFPVAPAFHLFDPLKHFAFGEDDENPSGGVGHFGTDEHDDEPVNALNLHNRLRALRHALADLPAQAARLARFNARRDALMNAGRPVRTSLMRPGLPPGWRERDRHEVDTVLKECHRLVRMFEDSS